LGASRPFHHRGTVYALDPIVVAANKALEDGNLESLKSLLPAADCSPRGCPAHANWG